MAIRQMEGYPNPAAAAFAGGQTPLASAIGVFGMLKQQALLRDMMQEQLGLQRERMGMERERWGWESREAKAQREFWAKTFTPYLESLAQKASPDSKLHDDIRLLLKRFDMQTKGLLDENVLQKYLNRGLGVENFQSAVNDATEVERAPDRPLTPAERLWYNTPFLPEG